MRRLRSASASAAALIHSGCSSMTSRYVVWHMKRPSSPRVGLQVARLLVHPVASRAGRVVAVEHPEHVAAAQERGQHAAHLVHAVELVYLLEPHHGAVAGAELRGLQLLRLVASHKAYDLPGGAVRHLHGGQAEVEQVRHAQHVARPAYLLVHGRAQRVADLAQHDGVGLRVEHDQQHDGDGYERRLGGVAPALEPVVRELVRLDGAPHAGEHGGHDVREPNRGRQRWSPPPPPWRPSRRPRRTCR